MVVAEPAVESIAHPRVVAVIPAGLPDCIGETIWDAEIGGGDQNPLGRSQRKTASGKGGMDHPAVQVKLRGIAVIIENRHEEWLAMHVQRAPVPDHVQPGVLAPLILETLRVVLLLNEEVDGEEI